MNHRLGHTVAWLRLLGVALLIVLLAQAGPGRLLEVASRANVWWLLLAWLLNLPQVGLKTLRWWLLLRAQSLAMPFSHALTAYFGALYIGFLTPGRVGELVKAVAVRHETGASLSRGLSGAVLDRLFDMTLLLALGLAGVLRFSVAGEAAHWPALILGGLALAAPLLLVHAGVVRALGHGLTRLPLPRREVLRARVDDFADGVAAVRVGTLMVSMLLTLAAYAVFFVQCACCAWALGFHIPWLDLVLLMAATNLLGFLPISIANLGTREAALVFFLARLAEPQALPTAVALGLTQFLVFFVGAGIIGAVCWQIAPLGLRREIKRETDPA